MWTWIAGGVVIVALLYILNKTAFGRIRDAGSAQIGKAAKSLWSADPIAVKNAEIDRKAEDIAEATRGLESCNALIRGVERQVKSGQQEKARVTALAEQYTREGNDSKALGKLTELEKIETDLVSNETQLKQHRETYEAYLKKIQVAQSRIGELRKEARSQGVRLQMSKAEANLAKLAPMMGKANLSFDNLDEVNEEIEAQIDRNKAAGQVVSDLAREGLEEIEAEERARTAAASSRLADMKAKLGVTKS